MSVISIDRPLALLAEADPAVSRRMARRLEGMGYEVVCAADGVEALRLAVLRMPEIAVLGAELPGIDVLDVARRFGREDLGARELPVVLLVPPDGAGAGTLVEAVAGVRAERALRRAEAARSGLAAEQAALRRVATAVARGRPSEPIFTLVAEEGARLLGAEAGHVVRFAAGRPVVVGSWRDPVRSSVEASTPMSIIRAGAIAQVLATGRPARIELPPGNSPLQGRIAAPVYLPDGLWGAVAVATTEAVPLAADATVGLSRFAELVALAIENAEMRVQLERRVREQMALRRVATLVARETEPRTVIEEVAREAASALDARVGVVVRFGRGRGWARVVGSWRAEAAHAPASGRRLPLGRGPLAEVARTGRPAREDDSCTLDELAAGALVPGYQAPVVAVPIDTGRRRWGAIAVAGTTGEPLPADAEECLVAFAELTALALANASAWARLTAQALTDDLTGLPNRRSFHELLEREVERAHRQNRPLSVIVLDLDHFKRVNDRHGHQVGDGVLREAARRIGVQARTGDTVARIGGEELGWILPETDGDEALRAAERARGELAARPFAVVGALTVSAGVCDLVAAGPAAGPEELFRLADAALYSAKAQGRDRSVRHLATRSEPSPAGAGPT